MANKVEGQLIDLWNREEESTGLKGWLEENISKKGISKLYDKTVAYQERGMAEEVFPAGKNIFGQPTEPITQGDLYEGITGIVGSIGKASIKTAEILKRTKQGKTLLDRMVSRIGKYPKDKPWMAIAVDEERRILEALPERLFENKKLLKNSIDKGEEFFNSINNTLKESGDIYDPSFIKDVLNNLYNTL